MPPGSVELSTESRAVHKEQSNHLIIHLQANTQKNHVFVFLSASPSFMLVMKIWPCCLKDKKKVIAFF